MFVARMHQTAHSCGKQLLSLFRVMLTFASKHDKKLPVVVVVELGIVRAVKMKMQFCLRESEIFLIMTSLHIHSVTKKRNYVNGKKGNMARKRYFKARKSKKTTKTRFIIKVESINWKAIHFYS